MPNFLSHKLGVETIAPNTSATNGFLKPYSGMSMDSYPGRPSSPSPLNGGSTLSTIGPSAHDLGPSDPPSDRLTPYVGPSGVIQSPPQGSQVLPDATGESKNSIRPSNPLVDRPTAQGRPSGAPEVTCDPLSAEGRHKYSRPPKPQEPKKSSVSELVWPTKGKPSVRSHPHSTQKEKVKFTFNITKCDKIFNELLKHGNIKLSHIIPSIEELKGHVYCKWHGSFLHNTNDCVVFHRQIQSAINECRLRFQKEVRIDRPLVPATTLEPTSKKIIVRPCAADKSKDKNIVIGDPYTPNMSRRVVTRMAPDKRKTGGARGQARLDTRSRSPVLRMPDGSSTKVGQSEIGAESPAMMDGQSTDGQKQQPKTIRPQRSKTSVRKQNTAKTSRRLSRVGPSFDQLFAKYMKKVVPHNRPIKPMKSKRRSVRKQKPTKTAQKVAQPRSPSHPSLEIARCFLVYPSPMCCPTHVWGGTAMNPYYWPNPFAFLGWGTTSFCLLRG
jgi:hypothetical protein